jgi:hypothetical protein
MAYCCWQSIATRRKRVSVRAMLDRPLAADYPKPRQVVGTLVNIFGSAIHEVWMLSFDLLAKCHLEVVFCQRCYALAAIVKAERDTMM